MKKPFAITFLFCFLFLSAQEIKFDTKKYDLIYFLEDQKAVVKLDGKYGLIDESGNEIIPIKYDEISSFKNGKAIVRLEEKYGLIDESDNELIPIKYDFIYFFENEKAIVKLEEKYGLINESGQQLIPFIYDNMYFFEKGKFRVKLGDKYGLIDESGKELIPLQYDFIGNLRNKEGSLIATLNNKVYYIDEEGNKEGFRAITKGEAYRAPVYPGCERFQENSQLLKCLGDKLGQEISVHINDVYSPDYGEVKTKVSFFISEKGEIIPNHITTSITKEKFNKEILKIFDFIADRMERRGLHIQPAQLEDGTPAFLWLTLPIRYEIK